MKKLNHIFQNAVVLTGNPKIDALQRKYGETLRDYRINLVDKIKTLKGGGIKAHLYHTELEQDLEMELVKCELALEAEGAEPSETHLFDVCDEAQLVKLLEYFDMNYPCADNVELPEVGGDFPCF